MPTPCVVCTQPVDDPQAFNKASWGPITLYFHSPECLIVYHQRVAGRLRDALVHALDRWYAQRSVPGPQRSTTDREPAADQ